MNTKASPLKTYMLASFVVVTEGQIRFARRWIKRRCFNRSVHQSGKRRGIVQEANRLIADGTIEGGIVAKMESNFEAFRGYVSRVHITCWEASETFDQIIGHSYNTGTIIEK